MSQSWGWNLLRSDGALAVGNTVEEGIQAVCHRCHSQIFSFHRRRGRRRYARELLLIPNFATLPKYKHHQFLTQKVGKVALRNHLSKIEAIFALSKDKGSFKRNFKKVFPQPYDQLELDFGEDV